MPRAMTFTKRAIENPEKRGKYVISVLGFGQNGLSMACLFAEAGFKVICVDVNNVNLLEKDKVVFSEPIINTLTRKHLKKGSIKVTKNPREAASTSDIILFILPTAAIQRKKPNYSYVERACREVGMGLRSGTLIIVRGTIAPGVTETLIREMLERTSGLKAGVDFGLAYSPIRALSGQVMQDITAYPMVVGAINDQSLKVACLVLDTIINEEIVKRLNKRIIAG